MPELPEVETTKRALETTLIGAAVTAVTVRQAKLRYPVPANLAALIVNKTITGLKRRAKYLLINFADGYLISHLGMSGSWQIVTPEQPPQKHDHIDIALTNGRLIRYHDPRRFGCLLWQAGSTQHHLLAKLGVEPLSAKLSGSYLYTATRHKQTAIKLFLMNNANIVGVGNIYANEALFLSRLSPFKAAADLSRTDCNNLVANIKTILQQAINQGGTTLRDFSSGSGQSGYFQQQLSVYAKAGQPCPSCATPIICSRQGQRATYFCPQCQL